MTITKPIKRPTADDFIAAAPDAAGDMPQKRQPKYVRKGKKIQITLTIAQPLLERVDELAQRLSLSRAAVINLAIHQGMERGITVDGSHRDGSS
ncbi:ribbon-helix-helix domain-containing protein [Candidatus Igneacidithiobacillus taiwanensis]|uniref:ribbon-helix-helix domain-containing protein n=1 Tax=Candidatus Igneacidithiobacillus taiwanensis TaxID=1945924 RepID=UPI0028A064AC|nr:ribbon-helix-helix domain-containing protein [Candidatus Igneacidithiobacillus taiwanensis]